MNKLILLITAFTMLSTGCKKDNEEIAPLPNTTAKSIIPFTGIWDRKFEAGPGNLHTAMYSIYQDSIRYTLTGSIGNANYVLERDTFIPQYNRFIGHTNSNEYYIMFTKNISNDSITIYKQKVDDFEEGLSIGIPSDTTTQNHGWNTFKKKL